LKKIFFLSSLNFLLLVIVISFFQIGKSDPINRIFIKTFNQFTNNYFVTKNSNNSSTKTLDVNKKILKNNLLIFSKEHTGHYQLAFNLFKENPIFGIGPKGFRFYCRTVKYDPKIGFCSTHPHNFFVQISSETGLVGLIIFLYLFFFVLYKLINCFKNYNHDREQLLLMLISICILVNLFPLFPSGNFFNNWISIINYYYIGIYIYSYNRSYNKI